MTSNSNEEARTKRWNAFFGALNFASLGSLWDVDEGVWKSEIPGPYVRTNDRRSHPGCAIGRTQTTLCAAVPMLHGTSSRSLTQETVEVDGVYGYPHKTYFGSIDPVPLPLAHWRKRLTREVHKEVLRPRQRLISPTVKAFLNPSELRRLQQLLDRKGW